MPASSPATATSEFRLVVACSWLAPEPFEALQEQAVAEALRAGIDWDVFLGLVDRHRVPALAYAVLRKFARSLPEPARAALKARSDAARMAALRHSGELLVLCKAFEAAAIPLIPLKGGVLSERLYGDSALRQAKDLDVLVRPQDLDAAEAIVLALGWRRSSPAGELSPRQRRFYLATSQHLEYSHPGLGTILELHWRLHHAPPKMAEAMWAHSKKVAWMKSHFLELDAESLITFLCNHGGIHAWFRLKWLSDIAAFIASGQIQDWPKLVKHTQDAGMMRVFGQCLGLVQALYGLPLPPELAAAFQLEKEIPRLMDDAMQAMLGAETPPHRGMVAAIKHRLMLEGYARRLNPGIPIKEQLLSFLFSSGDFEQCPMPDWLFWAYPLLRPVLWLQRRRGGSSGAGRGVR